MKAKKEIKYECQRCGTPHYRFVNPDGSEIETHYLPCCDFDDMGGNDY